MAIFKERLPTKSAALTVFIICILASNLWAIFRFLHEVPRYLIVFDNLWETISLFAYFGLQSLIDSVLFWLFMLAMAALLPARWLRDNFAVQGSWVVLGLSVWIILKLQWYIRLFDVAYILATVAVIAVLILLSAIVANPQAKWRNIPSVIIERLTVLGYLYLALDIASLIIVFVRNLNFSLS